MSSVLFFEKKKYISSKDASKITGYSKDYIGQLSRLKKIDAKRIGRVWYVQHDSILNYKNFSSNSETNSQNNYNSSHSHIQSSSHSDHNNYSLNQKNDVPESFLVYTRSSYLSTFLPNVLNILKKNASRINHRMSFTRTLVAFCLIFFFALTAFSLSQGLSNAPRRFVEGGFEISKTISKTPSVVYDGLEQVTDFYSTKLQDALVVFGTRLTNFDLESNHQKNIAFVTVSSTEIQDPVDRSAVTIYRNINRFFDHTIYVPFGSFLQKKSSKLVIVPVSKNDSGISNKLNTQNTSVQPIQKVLTVLPVETPIVNPSSPRVVERIIERVIEPKQTIQNISVVPQSQSLTQYITSSDLESRLEQFNNQLSSRFSSLSTGSGGSVTNIYQQIAQSQRIDSLTGTSITNPTITGGSLNNVSVSASQLSVSGSATSTFAGGIAVTGGCISLNGTCIGSGGSASVSGSNTEIQFNSSGSLGSSANFVFDYINSRLGIGTTSPSRSLSVSGNGIFTGDITSGTITLNSNATSTISGGLSIATGLDLNSGYIYGAGLTSCSGSSDKLMWDASTGKFGCGVDSGSTGGLTSLSAQYSSAQIGATQTFATSSDTNLGLVITSSSNVHTFTPTWIGVLSAGRGGTGISSPTAAGVLLGNYSGVGYQQIATSSLGLLTTHVAEGSNLYYTNTRVDNRINATSTIGTITSLPNLSISANQLTNFGTPFYTYFSATTTDALAQGTTNKYYSDTLANIFINASTTIPKTYTANTFTALQTVNYSSSTIYSSFITASTTNLSIGGSSFNSLLGSGLANVGGVLTVSAIPSGSISLPKGNFLVGNDAGVAQATSSLFVSSIGNIGLGTTTPGSRLSVVGSAYFDGGTVTASSFIATSSLTIASLNGPLHANNGVVSATSTIGVLYGGTGTSTQVTNGITYYDGSKITSGTSLVFTGTNIGIGTTSPSSKISVSGDGYITGGLGIGLVNTTSGSIRTSGTATFGSSLFLATLLNCNSSNQALQTDGSGTVSCGSITGGGATVGGGWSAIAPNIVRLSTSTDIVGIGTTSPYAKLSVNSGATGTTTLALVPVSGQTANILDIYNTSASLTSVITSAGNLGISTTTPGSLLSIGNTNGINFSTATSTFSSTGGINLASGCFAISGTCLSTSSFTNTLASGGTATTTFYNGGIVFSDSTKLTQTASPASFFWDNTNLRLGLGTTTPGSRLSVVGSAYFDGGTVTASSFIATSSLTIASLNGPLHANNGVVSATSTIGVLYGGTGWSNITANTLLLGNGTSPLATTSAGTNGQVLALVNGIPTWQSTTTLSTISGLLPILNGGTNATSFANNTLIAFDGTRLVSTSTPTFGYFNATSTTATSTIAGGLAIGSNFVVQQSTGNVGIGTPLPGARINLVGASSGQPLIRFEYSGGNRAFDIFNKTEINANGDLVIQSNLTNGAFIVQDSGQGNNMVYDVGTGQLGVNLPTATAPVNNFSVNGNGAIGAAFYGVAAPTNGFIVQGSFGVGTTTPAWSAQVAGTRPSLAISDISSGTNLKHVLISNNGGNLYIGTSTDLYATSTLSALTILNSGNIGISTTTPGSLLSIGNTNGINFSTATSTFSSTGGINLASGCFAIGGTCLLGSFSYDAFTHPAIGQSATTSSFALGTTTMSLLSTLTLASSTAQQLSLSAGAGLAQWAFRNAGGNLYLSTSTISGGATTTLSALTVLNGGNVGIGTTSPSALLTVQGTLSTNSIFNISSSSGSSILSINKAGTLTYGNSIVTMSDTSGSSALTVGNNGTYSIQSANGMQLSAGNIRWLSNSNRIEVNNGNSAGILYLGNSGEELTISSGNVGIGNTSPSAKLAVYGGNSSAKNILFGNWDVDPSYNVVSLNGTLSTSYNFLSSGTSGSQSLYINRPTGGDISFRENNSAQMIIKTGGNVGIGTTTPWRTFAVTGTVGFDGLTAGAGAGALCLSANKEVMYSAGAGCTVSSGRFKHDIATSTSGLVTVNALRPVTFLYNENIGVSGEQFGFIAEEVEKIDPRLVVHEASGIPFSVRYENFTAVLAKALQEEDVKVNNIASTTAMLASSTLAIDARLMNLESLVASSTPQSLGTELFNQILSAFQGIGATFADGIAYLKNVYAENLTIGTQQKPSGITIYDEVTGDPFCLKMRNGAMVSAAGDCATATSTPPTDGNATSTPTSTVDIESPIISIIGNNPAQISLNSSYVDLGATVTDMGVNPLDPSGPLVQNSNLGIHFTVDGVETADISLDTSSTTTHTIVYSSVDGAGNWGYATRTVEVLP